MQVASAVKPTSRATLWTEFLFAIRFIGRACMPCMHAKRSAAMTSSEQAAMQKKAPEPRVSADLQKERDGASFPVRALTHYLDGGADATAPPSR